MAGRGQGYHDKGVGQPFLDVEEEMVGLEQSYLEPDSWSMLLRICSFHSLTLFGINKPTSC